MVALLLSRLYLASHFKWRNSISFTLDRIPYAEVMFLYILRKKLHTTFLLLKKHATTTPTHFMQKTSLGKKNRGKLPQGRKTDFSYLGKFFVLVKFISCQHQMKRAKRLVLKKPKCRRLQIETFEVRDAAPLLKPPLVSKTFCQSHKKLNSLYISFLSRSSIFSTLSFLLFLHKTQFKKTF